MNKEDEILKELEIIKSSIAWQNQVLLRIDREINKDISHKIIDNVTANILGNEIVQK